MNRHRLTLLISIAASFLASWLLFALFPGYLESANLRIGDAFFRIRHSVFGHRTVNPYVVHVDMDDASLAAIPQKERGSRTIRKLLRALSEAGVETVVLDAMVAPSDGEEPLGGNPSVYSPIILRAAAGADGRAPERALWVLSSAAGLSAAPPMTVGFRSAPEVEEASKGLGNITCYPDRDGTYRRVPLLSRAGNGFVPFLSLRAAAGYLGIGADAVDAGRPGWITLRGAAYPDGRIKDIGIPVDAQGRMIVNFAGPWDAAFPHYPASRLLEALEDPAVMERLYEEMQGDIVILSDVSSGGKDFGPIPLEDFSPLSGIHANVVSSILQGDFLRDLSFGGELAVAAALCALLWVFAARWKGVSFVVLAAAALAAYLAASFLAFAFTGILMDAARVSLSMVLAGATVAGYGYMHQERQKAAFRARIERFFPPAVLDKIMGRPELLEGCEKKVLTILFSDIVQFSTWSADRAPEEIRSMLNGYFARMADITFRHGGTIDKYIGDGMLIFFGDPIDQPDHARRAVECAVEMQKAVQELRAQWEPAGGMSIRVRIGINTGEVVVGNLGSESRLDYTVIGSHVNLAQRLEGNAPPGKVLISRSTYEALAGGFRAEAAGTVQAKGFPQPMEVFVVEA